MRLSSRGKKNKEVDKLKGKEPGSSPPASPKSAPSPGSILHKIQPGAAASSSSSSSQQPAAARASPTPEDESVKVQGLAALAKSRIGAAKSLRAAKIELCHIVSAGFTGPELFAAGFPVKALKAEGVTCEDLRLGGLSVAQCQRGGFDKQQLLDGGFSETEVQAVFDSGQVDSFSLEEKIRRGSELHRRGSAMAEPPAVEAATAPTAPAADEPEEKPRARVSFSEKDG